jgi:hypothetical protein
MIDWWEWPTETGWYVASKGVLRSLPQFASYPGEFEFYEVHVVPSDSAVTISAGFNDEKQARRFATRLKVQAEYAEARSAGVRS